MKEYLLFLFQMPFEVALSKGVSLLFQAYASEVASEEYHALCLSVVRLLFILFILLLAMFTSSSLISGNSFYVLHVFQVSTSRGIGLIIGPAIGGYLAQVHFTLNSAYTNFTFLTFS